MTAPGSSGAFADPAALADRLARWRVPYGDRMLFRAAAGPRWLRLHLAGDEHFCLLLTTIPGATQLTGFCGRLPEPLATALRAERDHPLPALLSGARLTGMGALPGERVACLRFTRADGSPLHLLHQLFGSPGNTALLDGGARCLWATRRPPHALLSTVPGRGVYQSASADLCAAPADDPTVELDHLADVLARELRGRAAAAVGRRLRAAEKLVAARRRDLEGAGDGAEHRRRAEALAARLHELKTGAASCEVIDPRDGTTLTIDLDPARSPATNLDMLFHRARKAERGREVIVARLGSARGDVDALTAVRGALDTLSTGGTACGLESLAAIQAWLDGRRDLASDGGDTAGAARRAGAPPEPTRPFRRYLIDDRWEAWVGRSSRENDELTHHAAHSRDLWFHAHGATGSHVIVRTGGRPDLVPRAVIEKAAGLAALHSKARNASLVPVVWTEKRYVRKPRKAPPGLAVTLRAQSLMVAPRIAPGVEPA